MRVGDLANRPTENKHISNNIIASLHIIDVTTCVVSV